MMLELHRKQTYAPPPLVTGTALLFIIKHLSYGNVFDVGILNFHIDCPLQCNCIHYYAIACPVLLIPFP
jgi:hypothetical protein